MPPVQATVKLAMDKLRLRDLQRWNFDDLDTVLPVAITHDSQTKWVVLGIADYNRLVTKYRSEKPVSHDSQADTLLITPEDKG